MKQENAKAYTYILVGVAVVVLGFIVVFKIFGGIEGLLEALGFKSDKEEKDAIESIEDFRDTISSNENPFNPGFFEKAVQEHGSEVLAVTQSGTAEIIKTIYDGIGYFIDTPSMIVGAFKKLGTKSQVSYISGKFYDKYKKDLFNYLYIAMDTGTQKKAFEDICKYVSSLPDYKR